MTNAIVGLSYMWAGHFEVIMIGAYKLKPGHYSFKSSIVFCCVNLCIQ